MERRSLNQTVELNKEQRIQMGKEIEAFYLDVRDESIGMIEKEQLIDLFTDLLAPVVYNKALDDAHKWYQHMQENLESDYYTLYKDLR